MDPSPRIGDAFYFAVQTFLTIGYGDITPASNTAKAFFILYTVLSLVVQLTVVTTFVASTLSMTPEQDSGPSTAPSEVCTLLTPLSRFHVLLCISLTYSRTTIYCSSWTLLLPVQGTFSKGSRYRYDI